MIHKNYLSWKHLVCFERINNRSVFSYVCAFERWTNALCFYAVTFANRVILTIHFRTIVCKCCKFKLYQRQLKFDADSFTHYKPRHGICRLFAFADNCGTSACSRYYRCYRQRHTRAGGVRNTKDIRKPLFGLSLYKWHRSYMNNLCKGCCLLWHAKKFTYKYWAKCHLPIPLRHSPFYRNVPRTLFSRWICCCSFFVPSDIWSRTCGRPSRKRAAPNSRTGSAPGNGIPRCPDGRWRSAILPNTWNSNKDLHLKIDNRWSSSLRKFIAAGPVTLVALAVEHDS